jgi:hypothetical protein
MEDLEGAVSRQLLHLISWKDMSIDLIQPHVPNDQLALNLKVLPHERRLWTLFRVDPLSLSSGCTHSFVRSPAED